MSSPRDDDAEEIEVDHYLTRYVPLFEQLRWEIQDTEECVRRYLSEKNLPGPNEIQQALEFASQYSSNDPPGWTEKLDSREKSNLEKSKNFRSRKAYWHANRVGELENALNSLRSWMMANFKAEESTNKPLQLSFEREKKLHIDYLKKSKS